MGPSTAEHLPAASCHACIGARPGTALAAWHDHVWGVPCRDDRALVRHLVLASFMSGSDPEPILAAGDRIDAIFQGFDPRILAFWDDARVARAVAEAGALAWTCKVRGAVLTARACLSLGSGRGLSAEAWGLVKGRPVQGTSRVRGDRRTVSDMSRALSTTLVRAGATDVTPLIAHRFLQSAGLINDHLVDCPRYAQIQAMADPRRRGRGREAEACKPQGSTGPT